MCPSASVVGWHIRLFSYMPHFRRSDLRRFWSELLARAAPPKVEPVRWQDPIYVERRRCVRNSRNRVRRCNLAAKLAGNESDRAPAFGSNGIGSLSRADYRLRE